MRGPSGWARDPNALITEGNALEDAGRLGEALDRYDAAIRIAPHLARAHLNRGNALLALDQAERAADAYATALRHDPAYAAAHYNHGNALARLNRRDEALAAYIRALELKPEFVDAEVALGVLYEDLGRIDEAAASYQRALTIDPNYAAVHANLGSVLAALGQPEAAVSSCRRALEIDSRLTAAQYTLGNALQELGRFEEAAHSYRHVLDANPSFALAYGNLGNALQALGRTEEAVASYRRLIELAPEMAKAHFDLGNAFNNLRRLGEAIESYRAAIRLDPSHVDAHCMLGNLLTDHGLFPDALATYQRALAIEPQNVNVHSCIGNTYRHMGRMRDAMASYEKALEIDPDRVETHSRRLFLLNALGEESGAELLAKARRFGELAARKSRSFESWNNAPTTNRPLRIGLVSGDLRAHPVGYFLDNVLTALAAESRGRLELFAYSNHPFEDDVSARIRACCRDWRVVAAMSDEHLAELIRSDGIDILMDLTGHTAHDRLPLFAWKPAPVQATWLGYFATTGISAIDYLIADPWTLPKSEEVNFSESIWRLPETRLCFTPPPENVAVGPLPVLANGRMTFGCFNHVAKMTETVAGVWARILREVPGSRLLLKCKSIEDSAVRGEIIKRYRMHGVEESRLLLEGVSPRAEYLTAYRRVDIALDPFPYPGGTTTAEALWMGVPVLTMAGRSFLSRQGVGLLANAGLKDWIATDVDNYAELAVAHARDLPRLGDVHKQLRKQVLASPIFDAQRFARHFEEALRGMWTRWCGEGPRRQS